jgi:hypothetical protein
MKKQLGYKLSIGKKDDIHYQGKLIFYIIQGTFLDGYRMRTKAFLKGCSL